MTKLKSMKFETEHIHFSLFSSSVFGAPVSPFNYMYYYFYYTIRIIVCYVSSVSVCLTEFICVAVFLIHCYLVLDFSFCFLFFHSFLDKQRRIENNGRTNSIEIKFVLFFTNWTRCVIHIHTHTQHRIHHAIRKRSSAPLWLQCVLLTDTAGCRPGWHTPNRCETEFEQSYRRLQAYKILCWNKTGECHTTIWWWDDDGIEWKNGAACHVMIVFKIIVTSNIVT